MNGTGQTTRAKFLLPVVFCALFLACCGLLAEAGAAPAQPSRPIRQARAAGSEASAAPQDEAAAVKAEAMAVAARLVEEFPKDAVAYGVLGMAHFQLGHSAEALKCSINASN